MKLKVRQSQTYNYVFDKDTGCFARWGETKEQDPKMSPYGPEIADIEISTICNGIGKTFDTRKPCAWCYKSNTGCGKNMSFETFKIILHKLPINLTQIAFGIGDIHSNPDLWDIMHYCRNNDYNVVVPNITINGMGITDEIANNLARTCGAVAVSRYYIESVCYDTIEKLSRAGLKQVNIHQLLASETYDSCFKLIDDIKTDPRLSGLNAVVFLMLKPKGERNKYHAIESLEKFATLIHTAQDKGIVVGMDSCTAPLMLQYADRFNQNNIIPSIEPCESTLFSIYINVDAEVFPCSFTEGTAGWEKGISILKVKDFLQDVWFEPRLSEWRDTLLKSSNVCAGCKLAQFCRSCPAFDITHCKREYVK